MIPWREVFADSSAIQALESPEGVAVSTLDGLKDFLDAVHIRQCLVKPYQEVADYPLLEPRELLPSFDSDLYEHVELPGFALVAFGRPLDYFSEVFQYDRLHPLLSMPYDKCCPLEPQVYEENLQTLASRMPRRLQESLRHDFSYRDVTLLDNYPDLLRYLTEMDRAQVMGLDVTGNFHLEGVFASFPSDIDTELKRFGLRIGKFVYGDNELYERNRMFVYQYFMELHGFPIASERRTSSALFARRLHRIGESFLLRVLGQSDRTLTTFISRGDHKRFPGIEKIALVSVHPEQREVLDKVGQGGYFLDESKRVVILRVRYRQHRYDPANLRQDRALSVLSQEVLHPRTGLPLGGLNIVRDPANIFLRLNDIVRGEYSGRIVYKRMEIVENTDTEEKRLKFLYTWLAKHQRRMISCGDEYFASVAKVMEGYLNSPRQAAAFEGMRDLYHEVRDSWSYIQQARRVGELQDIAARKMNGRHLSYLEMCMEAVRLLTDLQFQIVTFFPELVDAALAAVRDIIHNPYLQRRYIEPAAGRLTPRGKDIRKNYQRLVALADRIKAVRKARMPRNTEQVTA